MIAKTLANFNQSGLVSLTSFGLVLFLAIFLTAIVWIFRKGSTRFYSDLSHLPLQNDSAETEQLHERR